MEQRVRLSGNRIYGIKHLYCECCGKAIIENYKAKTPIYYVDDSDDTVRCPTCHK